MTIQSPHGGVVAWIERADPIFNADFLWDASTPVLFKTQQSNTQVPVYTHPPQPLSAAEVEALERMIVSYGDVQFRRGQTYAAVANGDVEQEAFTSASIRGNNAQAELVATVRRLAAPPVVVDGGAGDGVEEVGGYEFKDSAGNLWVSVGEKLPCIAQSGIKTIPRMKAYTALHLLKEAPAPGRDGWIAVGERLPEMDVPVWLYEGGTLYIGARGDGEDGWLWGKCYSIPYARHDGSFDMSDCEQDDDYQPTHWQPLPPAPRSDV